MWLEQLKYNQSGYYNVFVSPAWMTDDSMLDELGDYFTRLYDENMEYIAQKRTKFIVQDNSRVKTMPIEIELDGVKVTFESEIEFNGMGEMQITRRLLDVSDENAVVEFKEYNRTCYGYTQYQGDMRGCRINIENDDSKKEIEYCYNSHEITMDSVKKLKAVYPQINSAIEMDVLSENAVGKAAEGFLFKPFITLSVSKEMKKGEELKLCLKIKQAD